MMWTEKEEKENYAVSIGFLNCAQVGKSHITKNEGNMLPMTNSKSTLSLNHFYISHVLMETFLSILPKYPGELKVMDGWHT